MTVFSRYQCWNQSRISEVINKEAISVNLVDFMATHAPLGKITYARAQDGTGISEDELLAEFVNAAQNDRHVFAVIQGAPGTGKSHLIRWLYQSYTGQKSAHEEVILIERAQNSLLGTLRQVVERLQIVGDTLRQQIDKLRGAAESLSERALADTILDNLRIATYEREESTKGKIRRGIDRFLLDPEVRDLLKGDNGPISRIVSFLTAGRRRGEGSDRPEFVADDFAIQTAALRRIQGYNEARDLADALILKLELREDLAAYLNRLLDYAISRTVVLSADDLKQTFNDLRRELRNQGRELVLFIEDITAFTGIDLGLIDVLATQHTGEANQAFCRLTSVVGITDSYYTDRFPPNMQERVSHHLVLHTSSLLQSGASVADFAARYLNAMRSDTSSLRLWFEEGAQRERLPNRCGECQYKDVCHTAFGSVDIGAGSGATIEVGLYPFNANALWNIYRRLDHGTISPTPRSLLNYVLLDVLQTHGHRVPAGSFPPPTKELATGITTIPALTKPFQQRVLDTQGSSDAARIQSLVLFWGDGTIDAQGEGSARTVSGLSRAVFQAFGLRQIDGILADSLLMTLDPLPVIGKGQTVTPIKDPPVEPSQITDQPRRGTKYDADIAKWREGEQLDQYDGLRTLLVAFIKESINWTSYGVSVGTVKERVNNRRFEIEGQSAHVPGDHFTFRRSKELSYALQALAELDTYGDKIEPRDLGVHLVSLSFWLRQNEAAIVAFVRQPTHEQAEPMRLVELLLLDCLLIEWLSDNLRVDSSPQDLLRTLLKGAGPYAGDREPSDQEWVNQIERARSTHSKAWTSLMGAIKPQQVRVCRSQLLKQLNQAQGESSDIRYIDAATALDVLTRLKQRNWAFRPIAPIDQRASETWKDAGAVYGLVASRIEEVLASEHVFQNELLTRMHSFTGNASFDEVFPAIANALGAFAEHSILYSLGEPPVKNTVGRAFQFLTTTAREKDRAELMMRFSAGTRFVEQIFAFTQYLDSLSKRAKTVVEDQERQISQLQAESDAHLLVEQATALYDEIVSLLRDPVADDSLLDVAEEVQR
jgi:hypothetical protein